MSKRQTIDAFFKKKDISHSELRTSIETNFGTSVKKNVDTSMPNERPFKCSRIESKGIDRDPRPHKQIYEFPVYIELDSFLCLLMFKYMMIYES